MVRRQRRARKTTTLVRYESDGRKYPASNRKSVHGDLTDEEAERRTVENSYLASLDENDPNMLYYKGCKKLSLRELQKLTCYKMIDKGYRIPWWRKKPLAERKNAEQKFDRYELRPGSSFSSTKSQVNKESLCRFLVSYDGYTFSTYNEDFESRILPNEVEATRTSSYSGIKSYRRKPYVMKEYLENSVRTAFYTVRVPQYNTTYKTYMTVDLIVYYDTDENDETSIIVQYGDRQYPINEYLSQIQNMDNVRLITNAVTRSLFVVKNRIAAERARRLAARQRSDNKVSNNANSEQKRNEGDDYDANEFNLDNADRVDAKESKISESKIPEFPLDNKMQDNKAPDDSTSVEVKENGLPPPVVLAPVPANPILPSLPSNLMINTNPSPSPQPIILPSIEDDINGDEFLNGRP